MITENKKRNWRTHKVRQDVENAFHMFTISTICLLSKLNNVCPKTTAILSKYNTLNYYSSFLLWEKKKWFKEALKLINF